MTAGHLDLITRLSAMYDEVRVTVMVNIRKTASIPAETRIRLLREACSGLPNVRVDGWEGLLADYMRINGEKVIVRGIRTGGEFESECQSAFANRILNGDAETVFLPARPDYSGISSSAVREIAAFGGDISGFVPPGMAEEISALLSK